MIHYVYKQIASTSLPYSFVNAIPYGFRTFNRLKIAEYKSIRIGGVVTVKYREHEPLATLSFQDENSSIELIN